MSKNLSESQLRSISSKAVNAFFENRIPLNDSITKIAEDQGLNNDQITRLCEMSNMDTRIALYNTPGIEQHKVSFPLANPAEIIKTAKKETNAGFEFTHSDYLQPPRKFTFGEPSERMPELTEADSKRYHGYIVEKKAEIEDKLRKEFNHYLADKRAFLEEVQQHVLHYGAKAAKDIVEAASYIDKQAGLRRIEADVLGVISKYNKEAALQVKDLNSGDMNVTYVVKTSPLVIRYTDYVERMNRMINGYRDYDNYRNGISSLSRVMETQDIDKAMNQKMAASVDDITDKVLKDQVMGAMTSTPTTPAGEAGKAVGQAAGGGGGRMLGYALPFLLMNAGEASANLPAWTGNYNHPSLQKKRQEFAAGLGSIYDKPGFLEMADEMKSLARPQSGESQAVEFRNMLTQEGRQNWGEVAKKTREMPWAGINKKQGER